MRITIDRDQRIRWKVRCENRQVAFSIGQPTGVAVRNRAVMWELWTAFPSSEEQVARYVEEHELWKEPCEALVGKEQMPFEEPV